MTQNALQLSAVSRTALGQRVGPGAGQDLRPQVAPPTPSPGSLLVLGLGASRAAAPAAPLQLHHHPLLGVAFLGHGAQGDGHVAPAAGCLFLLQGALRALLGGAGAPWLLDVFIAATTTTASSRATQAGASLSVLGEAWPLLAQTDKKGERRGKTKHKMYA